MSNEEVFVDAAGVEYPWDTSLFGGSMSGSGISLLKERNPIPALDQNFRFDDSIDPVTGEKRHDYYIRDSDGERKYKGSCTGIIAEYKREFDATAVYKRMQEKGRIVNPEDEYYGYTQEQCVAQWKSIGEDASAAGSLVHAEIEKFFNGSADWLADPLWCENADTRPSLLRFMKFHRDFILEQKIVMLRTELVLHNEKFEFAGSIDGVAQRKAWMDDPEKKNWVILMDWKRSKKDLVKNAKEHVEMGYGNMIGVCSSLPDCALSGYRLQLTLYALILMSRTSLIVKELYVVAFHSNHASYDLIPIEPLYEIASKMLIERRQKLIGRYLDVLRKQTADQPDASLTVRTLYGLLKNIVEFGAKPDAVLGEGGELLGSNAALAIQEEKTKKKRKTTSE
jgi:hypothetical protein